MATWALLSTTRCLQHSVVYSHKHRKARLYSNVTSVGSGDGCRQVATARTDSDYKQCELCDAPHDACDTALYTLSLSVT